MEDLLALARRRTQGNNFMHHNFIALEAVEPDRAVCVLRVRPESRNTFGMIHGGALYALADNAAGAAVHTDGRAYVTQEGTLRFFRNVEGGTVRAEARVRHRGGTLCLAEVELRAEDGTVLGAGDFTFFCVGGSLKERLKEEGTDDR
jgi:acyl-CoA thioesterase